MIDPDLKFDVDLEPDEELLWAGKASAFNISIPILAHMLLLIGFFKLIEWKYDFSYTAQNALSLVGWVVLFVMGVWAILPCFQRHYITTRSIIVRHGYRFYSVERIGAKLSHIPFLGRRVIFVRKRVPPPIGEDEGMISVHYSLLFIYGVKDIEGFMRTASAGEAFFSP